MNLNQFIPIDPNPLYQYFNAKKDWQKKRIDEAIIHYQTTLVDCLIEKLRFQEADLYQLAHDDFVQRCGQVMVYGSKVKKEFALVVPQFTKLYNIEQGGNSINGKVSFVTLNFNLKQLLRTRNIEDLLVKLYGDVDITDPEQVDITPIDINSLRSYMKANESYRNQNDKIKEYHEQADTILMIAEITNGVLPQIINESDFGRRYYKGFNLQNISKVVRNAALGNNYEYDLNTAVYAIKLNYASDITDKKFTYTSEYIEGGGKYKDSIRKRLTLECFDIEESDQFFSERLKIIKQAITAIGFGATKTGHGFYDKKNNVWKSTSLYDIFSYTFKGDNGRNVQVPYTKMVNGQKVHSVDLFLQDDWMCEFITEQQEMTKLIVEYMKFEKVIGKESHPFLVDGRNAINESRAMAYFFQKTERLIMDTAIQFMEDNGVKVLLRVHDAVHTDKKVNLKELHVLLHQSFVSANMQWLGTKIISFEEVFNSAFYYDDDIEQHKSRIAMEERKAINEKGITPGFDKTYDKPKKTFNKDHECYDGVGYDGSGYENYNPELDDTTNDMSYQERQEHYRIIGHNPNKLPTEIRELL